MFDIKIDMEEVLELHEKAVRLDVVVEYCKANKYIDHETLSVLLGIPQVEEGGEND